jgi:hypothetical protein
VALIYSEGLRDVTGCITYNMGRGSMMFQDTAAHSNVVIIKLFIVQHYACVSYE